MAWDASSGKKVWENKEHFPNWSGALVTGGDVAFYGTLDGWFKAVDARTGKLLSKFKVGSGIVGSPITYRGPDGKQYVAVYAGIGGDWFLLAGDVRSDDPADVRPPSDPYAGAALFSSMNCDGCHGGGGIGWVGPSLVDGRWRYGGSDEAIFTSMVYGRPKGIRRMAASSVRTARGCWWPTSSRRRRLRSCRPRRGSPAAMRPLRRPHLPSPPRGGGEGVRLAHRASQSAEGTERRGGCVGTVPMPPNPQVPDADLHALVEWVLSLK